MIIHTKYPPQIAVAIDLTLSQGALLIERKGIIQINLKGKVLLIAYISVNVWVVELPLNRIKTVVPVSEG